MPNLSSIANVSIYEYSKPTEKLCSSFRFHHGLFFSSHCLTLQWQYVPASGRSLQSMAAGGLSMGHTTNTRHVLCSPVIRDTTGQAPPTSSAYPTEFGAGGMKGRTVRVSDKDNQGGKKFHKLTCSNGSENIQINVIL